MKEWFKQLGETQAALYEKYIENRDFVGIHGLFTILVNKIIDRIDFLIMALEHNQMTHIEFFKSLKELSNRYRDYGR